jgi:hypothetical protein
LFIRAIVGCIFLPLEFSQSLASLAFLVPSEITMSGLINIDKIEITRYNYIICHKTIGWLGNGAMATGPICYT